MKRLLFPIAAALTLPAGAQAPAPPPEAAGVRVLLLTDLGSGQVLAAREPERRFAPASMAKTMTAYAAFAEMRAGRLRPDQRFTVSEATARAWSGQGTSLWLKPGQRATTQDLLHGIVTVSANDASVVLAEGHAGSVAAWTALMNREARQLGMTASHFATPNGWPDGGATYVTARDLAKLGRALTLLYPDDYRRYFGQRSFVWNGVEQFSKNPVTGVVAGADGIKTGHTNEAGYNFLGSAERDGRRLVLVVAGAKSEAERAAASRALLEWGFAAWDARALFRPGQPVAEARVQGGDARHVALVSPVALHASLPKGQEAAISLTLRYRGPLIAPIAKGAEVAELEIRVAGQPSGRVPLQAANDVGEAGLFDRLINGLYGLFTW